MDDGSLVVIKVEKGRVKEIVANMDLAAIVVDYDGRLLAEDDHDTDPDGVPCESSIWDVEKEDCSRYIRRWLHIEEYGWAR